MNSLITKQFDSNEETNHTFQIHLVMFNNDNVDSKILNESHEMTYNKNYQ